MSKLTEQFSKNLPQGRALIYIVVLCMIPSLLSLLYIFDKMNDIKQTKASMANLKEQAYVQEKRQAINQTIRSHFKEADHFYIDKNLETLTFLEPEVEALQKITQQKNFPDDEGLKKRLEFLTGSGNTLSFSEGVVQTFGPIQETPETQGHPVEVNVKDINKILSRVEGVKVGDEEPLAGRPQLLILDFKLDKKKLGDKNEVYLLNMKLLKREFP